MQIKDYPKLESPFVREEINGHYVVTPKIAEGFEWVFDDNDTIAVEKLHGTNVSIVIEGGRITRVFNRKNEVLTEFYRESHILDGIKDAYQRGHCNFTDGQYFGELIGPKFNGNKHNLNHHTWIPFDSYAREHLAYKSWGKYPKTFESISEWFKNGLFSLLSMKDGIKNGWVEGVVFYGKNGQRAKLRRDMFDWFEGERH